MINLVGKIQIAIGTTAERMSVTPLIAEPVFDTDLKLLYIGDGSTVGGILVNADQAALQAEIDQLNSDLADEVTNRTNADTSLQSYINVNIADIAQEILDRVAADAALQSQITTNATAISTEVTNRTNADDTLQNNINLKANISSLAPVALSGLFADLTSKPITIAGYGITDLLVNSVNGKSGVVTLVKADIGLSNVDNTTDLLKPLSTATITALTLKANISSLAPVAFSGAYSDLTGKPSIPSAQVNTDWNALSGVAQLLNKPTTITGYGITDLLVNSVNGKSGVVTLTKADIGLSNVDNTTDLLKPISTATQSALNLKAAITALAPVAFSGLYSDLTSKPALKPVATSGLFTDLTAIPTTIAGYGITDAINVSEKGTANGVATLDSTSKIPNSQLPPLAITESYVVASEAAQLALTAQEGDVAIRTDISKSYINNGGTAGTMADWNELLSPSGSVSSVNGKTGAVTLDSTDIGLSNVDNTSDVSKPLSSADVAALALKVNYTDLATVATTGSYDDLSDKPTIVGQVNADWDSVTDPSKILNKPTIPAAQVNTDWGASTGVEELLNKPTSIAGYGITDNLVNTINGRSGGVTLTSADVGLDNVDNTADLDKPISTDTQTAIDLKADKTYVDSADTTLQGNINTNTTAIGVNAGNISTNTTDIATNATAISTNTTDIATNATAISTEVTNRTNADITLQDNINLKQDAFTSQLANKVYASPDGTSGLPVFRSLLASDIPSLGYVSSSLTLTAGTGLTGGGDLSTNRTVSLSSGSIASLALANSALQSSAIGSSLQAWSANLNLWSAITPSSKADASALAGYLALTGGTLSGNLIGTTATFSGATITPIPAVEVNASATMDATYLNRIIVKNSGAAHTLTITNTLGRSGDVISFVNNTANNISISPGTGITIYSGGASVSPLIVPAYSQMTITLSALNSGVAAIWNN